MKGSRRGERGEWERLMLGRKKRENSGSGGGEQEPTGGRVGQRGAFSL